MIRGSSRAGALWTSLLGESGGLGCSDLDFLVGGLSDWERCGFANASDAVRLVIAVILLVSMDSCVGELGSVML